MARSLDDNGESSRPVLGPDAAQDSMNPENPADFAALDPQALRDRVEELRQRLSGDEELQRRLRGVTSAAGLAEVAAAAGVPLSPAALVKDFARRLLESEDALTVLNFDNCGWDQGELAWLIKTWQ